MQQDIEVVNGVFKGLFPKMADIYEKQINGILYEYMTPQDREFIRAHFPGMEDFFPLYALYAAVEKAPNKIGLDLLVWVMKDRITQNVVFCVSPSFDRNDKIRSLLAQAMEEVGKYLPNKITLSRIENVTLA